MLSSFVTIMVIYELYYPIGKVILRAFDIGMRGLRLGCLIEGLDVRDGAAVGLIRCVGFRFGAGLVILGQEVITGSTFSGSCSRIGLILLACSSSPVLE